MLFDQSQKYFWAHESDALSLLPVVEALKADANTAIEPSPTDSKVIIERGSVIRISVGLFFSSSLLNRTPNSDLITTISQMA